MLKKDGSNVDDYIMHTFANQHGFHVTYDINYLLKTVKGVLYGIKFLRSMVTICEYVQEVTQTHIAYKASIYHFCQNLIINICKRENKSLERKNSFRIF